MVPILQIVEFDYIGIRYRVSLDAVRCGAVLFIHLQYYVSIHMYYDYSHVYNSFAIIVPISCRRNLMAWCSTNTHVQVLRSVPVSLYIHVHTYILFV